MAKYTKKIYATEVTNKLKTWLVGPRVRWEERVHENPEGGWIYDWFYGYELIYPTTLGEIIPFGSYLWHGHFSDGYFTEIYRAPVYISLGDHGIDLKKYDVTDVEFTFFSPKTTIETFSVSMDSGGLATLSRISRGENSVNLSTNQIGNIITINAESILSPNVYRRLATEDFTEENPYIYMNTVRERSDINNAEIYSTTADQDKKPYVIVHYKDKAPKKPSGLVPEGETINPRDKIRFSWVHNAIDGNPQKAFELQYTDNKGTTKTIKEESVNQFKELPANTFQGTGSVRWQVRTQAIDGEWSEWMVASFYLGILPQQAPIPISPINQYVMQDERVRFEWSFRGSSTSEKQTKAAIRYSADNGDTWKITTIRTSNEYYSFPLDTFPTGVVLWQVKTTNDHDEESPYSEMVKFTIIGKPGTPKITNISKTLRPKLTWDSNEQKTYQIILEKGEVVFDSGLLTGSTIKTFELPFYIQNGEYRYKVRIGNEYNILSNWAESKFEVKAKKGSDLPLILYNDYDSVVISLSDIPINTIIYRDGKAIGKTQNNELYFDYSCHNHKKHKYQLVSYSKNNLNYSESDIMIGHCSFRGATIAPYDNLKDYVHLQLGINDIPQTGVVSGIQASMNYYDGRLYPVMESSGSRSTIETCKYYIDSIEMVLKFNEFINNAKVLLYRSNDGRNYYGNITSIEYKPLNVGGYEVSFSITRTDYERVIELD